MHVKRYADVMLQGRIHKIAFQKKQAQPRSHWSHLYLWVTRLVKVYWNHYCFRFGTSWKTNSSRAGSMVCVVWWSLSWRWYLVFITNDSHIALLSVYLKAYSSDVGLIPCTRSVFVIHKAKGSVWLEVRYRTGARCLAGTPLVLHRTEWLANQGGLYGCTSMGHWHLFSVFFIVLC
uniref:uncharacterized protein LOC122579254 n=1 Tax=Erigeron canadensis TaxID=72917 RepID=UPI001CB8F30D|nr:uncharacterized protein LOC122579254 [Erigeron canadensis]